MSYDAIGRAAFLAEPDTAPWTEEYLALPFPEQWTHHVLTLANVGRDPERALRTAPTRRLDGVLQTLAPDLVVRPRPRRTPGRGEPPDDLWLYAPARAPLPLPTDALHKLVSAWLLTLAARGAEATPEFRAQLLRTDAALRADPPQWQPTGPVDLLGAGVTAGGTAEPAARQFQLATDALARRIARLEPFPFDGGTLEFRAVPRGPWARGAELLSQPLCRTVNRQEWWFSIALDITLHTVPFDPRPRLHLEVSVRRWATHPRNDTGRLHLPYGQATSVYLRPRIPWLPGVPQSDRYAVARLVKRPGADAFTWHSTDPAGILGRLSLGHPFPDPDALLSDPAAWLDSARGTSAAVVHHTRMGSHEIRPGLMSHQRSELVAWAEQALPPGVVRAPDLVRCVRGRGAPANPRPKPNGDVEKKAEALRAAIQRRQALAVAVPGPSPASDTSPPVLEARLLWQTAEFRDAAITGFGDVLALDGDGGRPVAAGDNIDPGADPFAAARPGTPALLEWHTPELTVRLRCIPLVHGLGDKLALDPAIRGASTRLADAIAERRRVLRDFLVEDGTAPAEPGVAVVEIAHPAAFRPSTTDPKFAMRLGCADAGLLTQFAVTPGTEPPQRRKRKASPEGEGSLGHRVRSAWKDAFRQLGVRVWPEPTSDDALPERLEYAALWMVKRRKDGPTRVAKHVPVAVRVLPLPGHSGLARVLGWDDDAREWVSYPRFLLAQARQAAITPDELADIADITDEDAPPDARDTMEATPEEPASPSFPSSSASLSEQRTELEQQRRATAQFLQRVLRSLLGTPVALLVHAQNSRRHWPWIQDGQVVRDLIKPGHAPAGRLDPGLRLVRVRSDDGRETPAWWGIDKAGRRNGLPMGLWSEPTTEPTDSLPRRVFYSTTEKPASAKDSPVTLDRLALRTTESGTLRSDAGRRAWNPTLLEIAILACHPDATDQTPADDPQSLALTIHQLRQPPDHTGDLLLPLPLHTAQLAEEYVLPTTAKEQGE